MNTKHLTKAKKVLDKILGPVSFGEMIYSYRISHEYNQVEFAELLKISKQDLCNIEKGRKLVSVNRAKNFAHHLGMSPLVFAKYALQDQLNWAGIKAIVVLKEVA